MARIPRRTFLLASSAAFAAPSSGRQVKAAPQAGIESGLSTSFPAQDPDSVREVVGKSHTDLAAVEALVSSRPALARAAWDWGFGDWESALGAASHMGRRDIADVLIAHGARPDLFTFAMLDQVDTIRAVCTGSPGIQGLPGPHGITLLAHAQAGKAARVIEYLETLGGADNGQLDQPLDDATVRIYQGEYQPAGAPGAVFRIAMHERRRVLTFQRDDRPNRILLNVGEHRFYPSGCPAVEFGFDVRDGRAAGFTIHDGDVVVRAERKGV